MDIFGLQKNPNRCHQACFLGSIYTRNAFAVGEKGWKREEKTEEDGKVGEEREGKGPVTSCVPNLWPPGYATAVVTV